MGSSVSYEVMGFKDGHWSILFVTADRQEALSEAIIAEGGKHNSAIKVIEQYIDEGTGEERPKTIYSGPSQGSHAPKSKMAHKSHAHDETPTKVEQGSQLHPERVTDLIDGVRRSVIVLGSICLVLVILILAYLSNPSAVSDVIDGFLK